MTLRNVNLAAFGRVPFGPASAQSPGAHAAVAASVVAPDPGGGAPLLLGPRMRPRDETIFWLSAAAEIEHALMAQYLFAAYSIDPTSLPAENDVRRLATEIRNTLLQIAREEMGHFISVQNLLHAVGGALHFGRQFSPFEFAIQPFGYRLEPATLDSLAKYVIAESPNRPVSELVLRPDPAQDAAIKQKLVDDIAPRAVRSNGGIPLFHVGALFERLHQLFKSELSDTDFRPGRGGLQAMWRDWGYEAVPGTAGKIVLVEQLSATSVSDLRAEAVAAIKAIGDQGEAFDAAVADGDELHFERFLSVFEKLEQAETALGRPIALPVVTNPATMPPPAPGGHITHARALRWAHLFNLRYRLLLDCLHHSLLSDVASQETSGAQIGDRTPKGILQLWTFAEMRRIKAISEKLVELPAGAAPASRAGPPFELPYSMRMPHIDADRWAMHADVFAMAAEFISREMLVEGETGADFLAAVAEFRSHGRAHRHRACPRRGAAVRHSCDGLRQGHPDSRRGRAGIHIPLAARPVLAQLHPRGDGRQRARGAGRSGWLDPAQSDCARPGRDKRHAEGEAADLSRAGDLCARLDRARSARQRSVRRGRRDG